MNTPRGEYFDGRYWKVKAENHPTVKHLKPKYQYVHRARLVMEKLLGRYLLSNEHVYHKDGDKTNDDPGNLEIIKSISQHNRKYRWKGGSNDNN